MTVVRPLAPPASFVEQAPPTPTTTAAARRFTAWDVCGVMVLTTLLLGVNQLGVVAMGTPLGESPGVRRVSAVIAVVTLVMIVGQALRTGTGPTRLPRALTAVWRDPPGAGCAFLLGAILALPVFGVYSPVLFNDSDSSRLLASILYVQHGHLRYFADTQEPFLPHVVLGPPMAAFGLAGVKIAVIATVVALVGTLAYVAYQVTKSMWGAAAAALTMLALAPIYDRAVRAPMYPLMLLLATLGGWFAYRTMVDGRHPWRYALAAGTCLALAPEAQAVGQLFLAVPLLVAVFAPTIRVAIVNVARIGLVIAVVSLPRLVVNVYDGGLSSITSYRTDYWITKGYVVEIQRRFWDYEGVSEPLGDYLSRLPDRMFHSLGVSGWLIVLAAVLGGVFCCRGRARAFVLVVTGFYLLAITVKQIPPYARYYSPIWPGMVLLVGALVAFAVRRVGGRGRPLLGGALLVALALGAAAAYEEAVPLLADDRAGVYSQPAAMFADQIDDGKGVIGARAHQMLFSVGTDTQTWGDQFLTEEEYVTYLTWPSDEAVLAMLQSHDIGWVIIGRDRVLETQYNNTWLVPFHHQRARHVQRVGESGMFCRWAQARTWVLLKVGSCPLGRAPVGIWGGLPAWPPVEPASAEAKFPGRLPRGSYPLPGFQPPRRSTMASVDD
jgi:hypothetical protein